MTRRSELSVVLLLVLALTSCAVYNNAVELRSISGCVVKIDSVYRYNQPWEYFVFLSEKNGSQRQDYMIKVEQSQLMNYQLGKIKELHLNR